MQIENRLTELSDKELESLHGNAIRLAQSGTAAQRAGAELVLPKIGDEVSRRIELLRGDLRKSEEVKRTGQARTRKAAKPSKHDEP